MKKSSKITGLKKLSVVKREFSNKWDEDDDARNYNVNLIKNQNVIHISIESKHGFSSFNCVAVPDKHNTNEYIIKLIPKVHQRAIDVLTYHNIATIKHKHYEYTILTLTKKALLDTI